MLEQIREERDLTNLVKGEKGFSIRQCWYRCSTAITSTLRPARFIQFNKSTGCCGAHSLAEVCSTLTRMPGKHRISGEQAMLFIGIGE
jgi:hypothetical protein